jgi:hypothetical protein
VLDTPRLSLYEGQRRGLAGVHHLSRILISRHSRARMDLSHLSWPFFDPAHLGLARDVHRWTQSELGGFERDEGGDGRAARQIFERLAHAGSS